MRHVAAEAIDAEPLPVREHGVHLQPCVGDGRGGFFGVRIGALLRREVVAVIELHGFIPIVRAGRPRGDVVAGHATGLRLGGEEPAAFVRGQSQRRAAAGGVGLEPEEVVLRVEEFRRVVLRAKAQLRLHGRAMAARDVVRHEVDDRAQARGVDAPEQRLEFREPPARLRGVVGAHVEAVPDRIRRTGDALHDGGFIRGQAGVFRRGRLPQHAGEPEVGEAHVLERAQRGVIDVGEFPAAILGERAVGFARLVHIAEDAREELVDARALTRREPRARGDRAAFHLEITAHVFVADARAHIVRGEHRAGAVVLREVLRIHRDADARRLAQLREAHGEVPHAWLDLHVEFPLHIHAVAPLEVLPQPHRLLRAGRRELRGVEPVRAEWQPHRRALGARSTRQRRRALRGIGVERDEYSMVRALHARRCVVDGKHAARDGDLYGRRGGFHTIEGESWEGEGEQAGEEAEHGALSEKRSAEGEREVGSNTNSHKQCASSMSGNALPHSLRTPSQNGQSS